MRAINWENVSCWLLSVDCVVGAVGFVVAAFGVVAVVVGGTVNPMLQIFH